MEDELNKAFNSLNEDSKHQESVATTVKPEKVFPQTTKAKHGSPVQSLDFSNMQPKRDDIEDPTMRTLRSVRATKALETLTEEGPETTNQNEELKSS